jgi:hypothetical protein
MVFPSERPVRGKHTGKYVGIVEVSAVKKNSGLLFLEACRERKRSESLVGLFDR